MIYEFLLLVGLVGYVALMLMGVSHGNSHSGHAGGHGHHGFSGKGGLHHGNTHGHGSSLKNLVTISPLDIFSLALGAGLTGLALRDHFPALLVAGIAAAGAIALTGFLVKPLTNFILKFASTPSDGLEGMVAKFARAESNFDALGRGTVTVEIDGQLSRLFAQLPPNEVGKRVNRGEELLIVEVLANQGKCIVSHELLDDVLTPEITP